MIVDKIFKGEKINQQDFEMIIRAGFEKLENPTEDEKLEYLNTLEGGNCTYCGIPWRIKMINEKLYEYKCFEPSCECLAKREMDRIYHEMEDRFNRYSKIPKAYWHASIRLMDRNVNTETVNAMYTVEKYLKEKKYYDYGLMFFGSVGTGKTHMAVSAMKAICIKRNKRGMFVKMSEFISNLIIKKEYMHDILENDVVLFDDIDKANIGNKTESAWVEEQVFTVINGLTSERKTIIATSNLDSVDKFNQVYNQAIMSRLLGACWFMHIKGEDYRLKQKDME